MTKVSDHTKIRKKTPKCSINGRSEVGPLDTLAQLGTKQQNDDQEQDFDLSAQTSADDKKALRKRARRKYMTGTYLGALIDVSKATEKSVLLKSYWNSYHCADELTLRSDGKVTGHYCKTRWCLVCNSIRTAQLINKYMPVLETWQEKQFVTLTVPNCSAGNLPVTLEEMYKAFATVKDRMKKQHQRGQAPKFVGLRKMECTYNPNRNDFHPHFHFIIDDKETSNNLVDYWLQEWNKNSFDNTVRGAASRKAQDIRPADDKSVIELFKYFTKVVQKPNKDGKRLIYADAMDVIFNAVKGKRVFQNFGFKLPVLENTDDEVTQEEVFAIMGYKWEKSDWVANVERVDYETGEIYSSTDELTGYTPSEKTEEMTKDVVVRPGHDWTPKFNPNK